MIVLGALVLPRSGLGDTWVLRLEAATTDYSSEAFSSVLIGNDRLELDGGNGYAAALEYRLDRHFGLELSFGRVELDARWRRLEFRAPPPGETAPVPVITDSDSGDLALQPLALAAYYHPLRSDRFDLFLGPQVAWIDYELGLRGPPSRDPEWALGAKLGVEVALGRSPWSVGLAVRHLEIQHEGAERDLYTGIGMQLVSAHMTYRMGRD
jgi:hypothetical protein